MKCIECYSEYKRITPLLKGEDCLTQHTQYICGTCGRCICIEATAAGLRRWNFPFQSLTQAMLYLRSADASTKTNCGIYEIKNEKGRLSYKIFANAQELQLYLQKNPKKQVTSTTPLHQEQAYKEFEHTQIRRLSEGEIHQYVQEQALEKQS